MIGRYDTSIDESRGELRRAFAAVFCSVALLLNILSGVALSFGPSHANLVTRALENGWNIACSTRGLTVIDADGNRVPDDQTGQQGSAGPHCIFCLPLMKGDVALATTVTTPAPADQLRFRRLSPLIGALVALVWSPQAWPRAPPSFLIG